MLEIDNGGRLMVMQVVQLGMPRNDNEGLRIGTRITSYNVCYMKLLRIPSIALIESKKGMELDKPPPVPPTI